jgi:hypothetical protein
MKKHVSILTLALFAAFSAPAFATFNTAPGAKQYRSDQVVAKKGGGKKAKASKTKSAKA